MVNKPLIRPYFLGGVALGGGTLDSHDTIDIFKTGVADEDYHSETPADSGELTHWSHLIPPPYLEMRLKYRYGNEDVCSKWWLIQIPNIVRLIYFTNHGGHGVSRKQNSAKLYLALHVSFILACFTLQRKEPDLVRSKQILALNTCQRSCVYYINICIYYIILYYTFQKGDRSPNWFRSLEIIVK